MFLSFDSLLNKEGPWKSLSLNLPTTVFDSISSHRNIFLDLNRLLYSFFLSRIISQTDINLELNVVLNLLRTYHLDLISLPFLPILSAFLCDVQGFLLMFFFLVSFLRIPERDALHPPVYIPNIENDIEITSDILQSYFYGIQCAHIVICQ